MHPTKVLELRRLPRETQREHLIGPWRYVLLVPPRDTSMQPFEVDDGMENVGTGDDGLPAVRPQASSRFASRLKVRTWQGYT